MGRDPVFGNQWFMTISCNYQSLIVIIFSKSNLTTVRPPYTQCLLPFTIISENVLYCTACCANDERSGPLFKAQLGFVSTLCSQVATALLPSVFTGNLVGKYYIKWVLELLKFTNTDLISVWFCVKVQHTSPQRLWWPGEEILEELDLRLAHLRRRRQRLHLWPGENTHVAPLRAQPGTS